MATNTDRESDQRENAVAVLDTNVWLDWLVFDNPAVAFLGTCAHVHIATCEPATDELSEVLARPHFALSQARQRACLAQYHARIARHVQLPGPSMTRLRCTDRADQKFLELAVTAGARLLFTRDKALLKLAKRARNEHRLLITSPHAWTAADD